MRQVSLWLALGLWLALSRAGTVPPPPTPASVQSCNTDCQEQETDCIERCDQDAACSLGCQQAAGACTQKCRDAGNAS
jgi:hypothetical protein